MVDFTGADGGLRELALFAGAGGGILGGHLLGWRTVCAVEWDAYAASILVARQNDKTLEPFPIWVGFIKPAIMYRKYNKDVIEKWVNDERFK